MAKTFTKDNEYIQYILDITQEKQSEKGNSGYITDSSTYVSQIESWYRTSFNNRSYGENNLIYSSPIVTYWYSLVELMSSMLYRRFPDYSIENNDVTNLLDTHKEYLDGVFYAALKQYMLYGSCCIMFSEDVNNPSLRVLEQNDYVYNPSNDKYFYTEGDIKNEVAKEELRRAGYKGSFTDVKIFYIDGCKYASKGNEVFYLSQSVNRPEVCLFTDGINSTPFVYKVYYELKALETVYFKNLETTKALKTVAIGYHKDAPEIQKVMDAELEVVTLQAAASFNNAKPNELISWWDNTPLTVTLEQQENEINKLKGKIVEKLNLSEAMQGATDNPNESRVAATDRIRKASIVWEKRQNAFNNYIEGILKHFIEIYLGIPASELDIELNSSNILTEEMEQAKAKQAQTELLALTDRVNNYAQTGDVESIGLIQALVNSESELSEELIARFNALCNFKIEGIMQARQTPPQPPQPTPQDQLVMAQVENTKAQTMKLQSDANLQNQKAASDAEQARIDNNIKMSELEMEKAKAEQDLTKGNLDLEKANLEVDKTASDAVEADISAEDTIETSEARKGFLGD